MPHLPGVLEGDNYIRSDEGRHVGWGVRKLREVVQSGAVDPQIIRDTLQDLMVHVAKNNNAYTIISDPGAMISYSRDSSPAAARSSPRRTWRNWLRWKTRAVQQLTDYSAGLLGSPSAPASAAAVSVAGAGPVLNSSFVHCLMNTERPWLTDRSSET
jgi:hypothetical protein